MKRVGVLLLVLLFAILAPDCDDQVFDGSRVKGPDQFLLVFQKLNGVQTHEMSLNAVRRGG